MNHSSCLLRTETGFDETEFAFDMVKVKEALTTLPEAERIVMEMGFGLNGEACGLERIAARLGRTKHWVAARLERGITRIRETLNIDVAPERAEEMLEHTPMVNESLVAQALMPGGIGDVLQQEVLLKSAIVEKWRAGAKDRHDLGLMLLKLRDLLAVPGRAGQFTGWLEANKIARSTAYWLIEQVEPPDMVENERDKLSNIGRLTIDDRYRRLLHVVMKLYDPFRGMSNGDDVLKEWDALAAKVRGELVVVLSKTAA